MTFGPRPGDVEEVRRLGVEKWIDLQLHPDRIPENPVLEAKLKPLETLRMEPGQIIKEFAPNIVMFPNLNELLPNGQLQRVNNGTAEERKAFLATLDPDKRRQVMAVVAPQQFAGFPELQKEAEEARKAQQEEQQKEFRRRMPPLERPAESRPDATRPCAAIRNNSRTCSAFWTRRSVQQVAARASPAGAGRVSGDAPPGHEASAAATGGRQRSEGRQSLPRACIPTGNWKKCWSISGSTISMCTSKRPRTVSLLASYERDAIRPHVLGHFKDLLLATARHPAMLYYLDNCESISPEVFEIGPFAGRRAGTWLNTCRGRRTGVNENYGRELMELHTLGVDGGYTQQDVIDVARCFTGWTIRQPNTKPEFVFAGFMHDPGEKTVLGHKIAAGGGEQDGLQVLDILAHHPSTAKFISQRTGAALRRRRSAASAGGPHGADVPRRPMAICARCSRPCSPRPSSSPKARGRPK